MTKNELIEQHKQQLLAQNWTEDAALAEAQRTYENYKEPEVVVAPVQEPKSVKTVKAVEAPIKVEDK